MAFGLDADVEWWRVRVRWKDFDLWPAMAMVLYVTHYYYDGLDSDFVSDDLDANRVKIVDTRGATIAGITVELMDLRFDRIFCATGVDCFWFFFSVRHRFYVSFQIAIFKTNNVQRKYTN